MADSRPPKDYRFYAPLSADEVEDACFEAKDKAWYAVADLFDRESEKAGVTYQLLADRIGRKKAQVHRWVDSSSNMTLQSLGLIAAGLNADVVIRLEPHQPRDIQANFCHPADDAAQMIALRMNAWRPNPHGSTHALAKESDQSVRRFSYSLEDTSE